MKGFRSSFFQMYGLENNLKLKANDQKFEVVKTID